MSTRLRFVVGLLCISMAMTTGAELNASYDGPAAQGDRERFVGAWRLAWLEEPGPDGKVHKADCTGLFVFTENGYGSVQVMYRNPAGGNGGSVQYAQGGYEASYGRYAVDERGQTWTFHVEGALVRSLVGKDLKRRYEFSGHQLIVTPSSPDEHWRVAWERQ
jgi:lipocalin-like protein